MAVLATSMVAVLATSMVAIQISGAVEQGSARQESRAVLAAEAGLSQSYMVMQANTATPGTIGSMYQPVDMSGGEVYVTTQNFGPGNKLVRVTSNSTVGNSEAGAELVLRDNVDTLFVFAAFGDTLLELDSQAKVDSFDSTVGTYVSQVVNGSGSTAWANDQGNIGSNGDIEAAQNSLIYGDAAPGVTSTITLTGTATVSGSTANATAPVTLPPIVVPAIPSSGNMTFLANTTLASGSYHFGTTVASVGVTVTVTGPATIVFDSMEMMTTSSLRVDSTNGGVDMYVLNDFVMKSNTLVASLDYDPRDVRLNLLSDNIINPGIIIDLDDVTFNSNAKLYGTIYAPDASIDIESNFEIFGSLIAEEVSLSSNCRVHYDEALGRVLAPGTERYQRISWRATH